MKIRSFSSYRKFALEIYEKILENEPERPIYFHLFSMNGKFQPCPSDIYLFLGCSLFTALWDLLDNVPDGAEIKKRVKGVIFDRYVFFEYVFCADEVGALSPHSLVANARALTR